MRQYLCIINKMSLGQVNFHIEPKSKAIGQNIQPQSTGKYNNQNIEKKSETIKRNVPEPKNINTAFGLRKNHRPQCQHQILRNRDLLLASGWFM